MISDDQIISIYEKIKNSRFSLFTNENKNILPKKSGIYGIFLNDGIKFSKDFKFEDFEYRSDGLIYIGISENLSKREVKQHFISNNSSNSTVRRSIGSIEKENLNLIAIPRGNGDCNHYRFADKKRIGEKKLTDWMCNNLKLGYYEYSENRGLNKFEMKILVQKLKEIEKKMIIMFDPPLNIIFRDLKKVEKLKKLREICKKQAYKNK